MSSCKCCERHLQSSEDGGLACGWETRQVSTEATALSWMMKVMGYRSGVYKEDRPHAWMVLNLIPPHPIPDRSDVPIQRPQGCHLDLVSVHLHSSQPEGPNLRSLTHMQIPLTQIQLRVCS